MKDSSLPIFFFSIFFIVLITFYFTNGVKHVPEKPCVGHCPPPGPMDCTVFGRKKDGSWPSGFECSSTP